MPSDQIANATTAGAVKSRILSIDALRGLVILLMLVDHTREFFYLHAQVSDPMDVSTTAPALFFSRLAAHLCAPVFVALTGLAAWLYAAPRGGAGAASSFLVRRGLFLIMLEWTVVNFAWNFDLLPPMIFLQVIWVIGLSMLALAALVHLPRKLLIAVGLVIVLGHNLLDPVHVAPGDPGHVLWAVLHDRGVIDLPFGGQARTSYPLLPWIGVIALGYAVGPWFAKGADAAGRHRALVVTGLGALTLFLLLRTINLYGEPTPWVAGETGLQTLMSFLNVTKYPPSADFLLLTLGCGALLLRGLEGLPGRLPALLSVFGSAPLFFYILHLYLLHALNRLWGLATGATELVSLPNVAAIWLMAALVAIPCWFACRRFAAAKHTSSAWWMKYL
ncbi:DUF1624 domain-containing protein [Altererythrobacter xixiisoli]|uniref:DUF1624 domain-containing protein n=1 Tax=Croceibacterium xixiisoli TaxID=1476466 RepID=A0A6I4TSC9_9SPHN|nr:heparan-alpha-glucosaminide N-acetyltransferase domain-containing protein [Croceibacterium xixiisoli]MXO98784.1 DUF1624 domain-containing protein [Croceibacterium xixiisoli]